MASSEAGTPASERRQRRGLRALIDAMMTQLRSAAQHDACTPEERVSAEADLERIMLRVRSEAVRGTDV